MHVVCACVGRVWAFVQEEADGVRMDAGDCGMLGGKYGIRTYGVSSSCRRLLTGWHRCSRKSASSMFACCSLMLIASFA